jgi:hypothetical protein
MTAVACPMASLGRQTLCSVSKRVTRPLGARPVGRRQPAIWFQLTKVSLTYPRCGVSRRLSVEVAWSRTFK